MKYRNELNFYFANYPSLDLNEILSKVLLKDTLIKVENRYLKSGLTCFTIFFIPLVFCNLIKEKYTHERKTC